MLDSRVWSIICDIIFNMYKWFIFFVIAAIGFLFWRMGPGNEVTYYENRESSHTETMR